MEPSRRDGALGGGTQRQTIELTGETLLGPAKEASAGREARKGETQKRDIKAGQGVGGGQRTDELRENRREGRAATFIKRTQQGKAAGLLPQGKAQPRCQAAKRKAPVRLNNARKLQRTLYRVAKRQPDRRFTLLYDKVCRTDILQEAWQRVKSNKGGVIRLILMLSETTAKIGSWANSNGDRGWMVSSQPWCRTHAKVLHRRIPA